MSTYEEAKLKYKERNCYRPIWNLGMFLWKLDFINGVPIRRSKAVIKDLIKTDIEATDWVIK